MSAPPGMSSNPFEVLGLDRSATFEDVKLAYRRLARQHHPDTNPNDSTALERFTALRRAYDRLKIFYQTLDEAGPAVKPASSPAGPQRPTRAQGAPSAGPPTAAPHGPPAGAATPQQVTPAPADTGDDVPE